MAWDPYKDDSARPIQERLERCQRQLQCWNQNNFGNIYKYLKQKQSRLQLLESLNQLHETTEEIHAVRKEINELHTKEEIMWNQRLRVCWLQNGDKNTKFFHATASQRQRKNRVGGMLDDEGVWQEEPEIVENIILDYFKSIFSSDQPASFDASLEAMDRRVTPEMNQALLKEFRAEEVWSALKQMHPTKAPGPDSMSPIFYQKY